MQEFHHTKAVEEKVVFDTQKRGLEHGAQWLIPARCQSELECLLRDGTSVGASLIYLWFHEVLGCAF